MASKPRPRPGRGVRAGRGTRTPMAGPAGRPPPHIRSGVRPEDVANPVAVAGAPALARLLHLPRWLPPLVAAAVLFTGLAAGGVVGLVLLLVLAAGLAWLLAAFWPMTPNSGRVLRTAVVLVVVLLAFARASS